MPSSGKSQVYTVVHEILFYRLGLGVSTLIDAVTHLTKSGGGGDFLLKKVEVLHAPNIIIIMCFHL